MVSDELFDALFVRLVLHKFALYVAVFTACAFVLHDPIIDAPRNASEEVVNSFVKQFPLRIDLAW